MSGVIESGPWAGWIRWAPREGRFGQLLGNTYVRYEGEAVEFVAEPEEQHRNNGGLLHGGYLMSVADQSLFAIARPRLSEAVHAVTLTFTSEFLGAGVPGKRITVTGDILRETGKLLFLRGLMHQDSQSILSFTGTLRKVPRQRA